MNTTLHVKLRKRFCHSTFKIRFVCKEENVIFVTVVIRTQRKRCLNIWHYIHTHKTLHKKTEFKKGNGIRKYIINLKI